MVKKLSETVKNGQYGQKFTKTVKKKMAENIKKGQYCQKKVKIEQNNCKNGQKLSKTDKFGKKWSKVVKNGQK